MSPGGHDVRRGARLSALAVAVVAILGLLYIVSQFLRNSVGVIAPNLAAEVGLSPIEIGLLSSIYFFCFAATQLPLGVALDRFGPKRCMLVSIAVTVAGSAAFALAHDVSGLVVCSRAARLRHRVFPDGAGRALRTLVSARAFLDIGRHPSRRRLARRVAGDGAAGVHRGNVRLARSVSRHRALSPSLLGF